MKRVLLSLFIWSSLLAAQEAVVTHLDRALASGDSGEVQALEQKLLSAPPSLNTLMEAGVLLTQHDKMQEAAAIFERCSRQYPASFEAKYNLALARIALAQYTSALDTLRAISPVTADEKPSVEYLTGKILLNTNHLKEAQASLASAYSQRPQEENYALDLALLYIRSAAYVEAIKVLQPSLLAHPKSQDLQLELALADVLTGSYLDGVAICRQLQKQDAESAVSGLIAAFSYCAQKSYKACEDEASAGLALASPHPYFYYLRARARWESGAADLDDVSKAIQKMPECGVCLLLRSKMFDATHDNDAAIADLKKAVQLDGQAAPAWYQLSVLYRKAGEPEEAASALNRYRAIHDNGSTQEAESFRKQFLSTIGDH